MRKRRKNLDQGNRMKLDYMRREAQQQSGNEFAHITPRQGLVDMSRDAWATFFRALVKHEVIDGAVFENGTFWWPPRVELPTSWSDPDAVARLKVYKKQARVVAVPVETEMTINEFRELLAESRRLGITLKG